MSFTGYLKMLTSFKKKKTCTHYSRARQVSLNRSQTQFEKSNAMPEAICVSDSVSHITGGKNLRWNIYIYSTSVFLLTVQ